MANEGSYSVSLTINKGHLKVQDTEAFQFDVATAGGPSPGEITVTIAGVDVDLSALTTPGVCVFKNLDPTNFVEVGIREPGTSTFYPLLILRPGRGWIVELSPNIQEEYFPSTGTGTTGPANFLHLKANTASCRVQVKAYEK